MKKTIFLTLTSFAICFVLLGTVSAQVRGNYSRRDVSTTIKNLENSSDIFSRDFKRQMDQGRRNNEDQFVRTVDNFENAVDRLRRNPTRFNPPISMKSIAAGGTIFASMPRRVPIKRGVCPRAPSSASTSGPEVDWCGSSIP